jgi:hypothetical protein
VPNRRRRKLSTAMSAVAALAVASPCAYFLVYESTAGAKPPEHHEFKQAAVLTDLPNELMAALSQGLSQFGINFPPIPALTGSGTSTPGLTSPGLTSPGLTSPDLTSPGLTSPGLTSPGLTPGTPGLTTPGTALPPTTGSDLTSPGLNYPILTDPALTSPSGITPGLTPTGAGPNEVPITSPAGLDPGADGTYPILGDPTLGIVPQTIPASTGSTGGGGLINDVMQVANQLGASQAIDLLKGVLMPAIMQGVQNGGAAAPAPAAPASAIPAGAASAAPAAAPVPAVPAGAAPAAAIPPAAPPVM